MAEPEKTDTGETASRSSDARGSLPSITLPKGGGAIRGIGEKFGANPVTGTGNLDVPVFTSASRSDFYPKLSLNYDSGGSSGPFGLGWSLKVPAIRRKTEKGLPLYDDACDSDLFILSDAEDLIPALVQTGADWAQDVFEAIRNGQHYNVKRFRPRVETAFARIERWTNTATGISFWKTVTRDNVTSLFGLSADSQIANPQNAAQVFEWLLEQTYDAYGNVVAYQYKAEDTENIAAAVYEAARSVTANRYLKRVFYGGQTGFFPDDTAATTTALPALWLFQVVFDYGEHDPATPSPAEVTPWTARSDPFSSYRSTFEVRTHRLCRRVLMFHQFAELGEQPCLVRSTDFTYVPNPTGSYLSSAMQTGYIRNPADQSYQLKDANTGAVLSPLSLPPLEFTYSVPAIDETLHDIAIPSADNVPRGVDSTAYRWIDFEDDGLAGILSEQGGNWFYKRNTSNLPRDAQGTIVSDDSATAGVVSANFEGLRTLGPKPSLAALAEGRQQLLDLAGDGRKCLVQYDDPGSGFYEQQWQGWGQFTPFAHELKVDWQDVNLRFVDLDGDGLADVLITENDVMTWYQSNGREGFGPANRVCKPFNEDEGPALIFADGTQSMYLADFSGDGLSDIVRIRNGEVCYWPNLGYGRFGAKITMQGAPFFDLPDQFDQRRIRLADIDGSGTTDLLYLGRGQTSFWFNQSGNGWSSGQTLPEFSAVENTESVSVLDLLGNGTACIVWSSPLPGDTASPMRYIDLMSGQKPHLLISIRNNLGAETKVTYVASTKFSLQDRAAGAPWVTKLPFPVHVVESVETFDYVSKNELVTRYAYHHGYYDGVEREFRGFGMVEQFDTFSYSRYSGTGVFSQTPDAVAEEYFLPPVHTKTWFHTGAYFGLGKVTRHFESEYYQDDPLLGPLPDTPFPAGLSGEEVREACRALKGKMLRTEVYADDGSSLAKTPYSVSESACQIRLVQPRLNQKYGSFYSYESEMIACHYERNPADPRVAHSMNLEVDAFGSVTKSAAVGYPRRASVGPPAPAQQATILVTYTENDVVNVADQTGWYRLGLPAESRIFELIAITPAAAGGQFRLDEMQAAVLTAAQISFETAPSGGAPQKRLLGTARTLYLRDDLTGALPAGTVESLALPYERYKMVFTPGLLNNVYGVKVASAALATVLTNEGGYMQLDGDGVWWSPSGRTFFSPDPSAPDAAYAKSHFYLAQGYLDPFANVSTLQYDKYDLSTVQAKDALNNTIAARPHFRVLQPWLVTDPNQNRSGIRFDALGMVTATAVMGKAGLSEGDALDLSSSEASVKDDPTTRVKYDTWNWVKNGTPNYVQTFARELHGAANLSWQETYSYCDGLGREVMKKIQAEPGLAPARDGSGKLQRDGSGALAFANTKTRWVGTGRIVRDNKGNPVKKYEPFFDSSPVYEDEQDLVQWGVTPILTYDALNRLVRTDYPDGTLSRAVLDPWQTTSWDQNDTVFESEWHTAQLGQPPGSPQRDADTKAGAHANTPAIMLLDVIGRPYLAIADNGAAGKYQTTTALDIQGNQLSTRDALNRTIIVNEYDLAGNSLHQSSVDAGDRWLLKDVLGKPIRVWNSRGFQLRYVYDALRRPAEMFVQPAAGSEILAEVTLYGEAVLAATGANLLTRIYQTYDAAGVATNQTYDFEGNLLSSVRQLSKRFQQTMDWSVLAKLKDAASIAAAAKPLLETEVFNSSTTYDALHRPIMLNAPDGSVLRPTFNQANLLETMSVNVRGAAKQTALVANVDYNARGQRLTISYGNGAHTSCTYDPESFRLVMLRTVRSADNAVLQDLGYAYDPVGNVTSIRDGAQQVVYFKNAVVTASNKYTYDALYRLLDATGREHAGQLAAPQNDWHDVPRLNQPLPTDGTAMRNYNESYSYDCVGNILAMIHNAATGSWTRSYAYDEPNSTPTNNRLSSSNVGASKEQFTYDNRGNMQGMRHLPQMHWDFKDQLQSTQSQVVNDGQAQTTFYVYDSTGQRVRKVTATAMGAPVRERIYLAGYELYREYNAGATTLERQTLHVMDDKRRLGMIETKTLDTTVPADGSPTSVFRFQFTNHLDSACIELDGSAAVISYEEYYPYGSTSFQAVSSAIEVSAKRYRYIGKECDDETGFNYHGVRYYARWLGRWISCDPAGAVDGNNLYVYGHDSPVCMVDPNGMETSDWQKVETEDTSASLYQNQKTGLVIRHSAAANEIWEEVAPHQYQSIVTQMAPDHIQSATPKQYKKDFEDTARVSDEQFESTYGLSRNTMTGFTLYEEVAKAFAPPPLTLKVDDKLYMDNSGRLGTLDSLAETELAGKIENLHAPTVVGSLYIASAVVLGADAKEAARMGGIGDQLDGIVMMAAMIGARTPSKPKDDKFSVSHDPEFYGEGANNADEVSRTLSGQGNYQLIGDHPPDERGQTVVRYGEGELLDRFADHAHNPNFGRVWRGMQVIGHAEGLSQRLTLEADLGLEGQPILAGEHSSLYKLGSGTGLGDFAPARLEKPAFTLLNPALYPSARLR